MEWADFVGGAVTAAITGGATIAVSRASARGSVAAEKVRSISDLERDAATRMAGIYDMAVEQLQDENAELRRRLGRAERTLVECQRACRALAARIDPDLSSALAVPPFDLTSPLACPEDAPDSEPDDRGPA